MVAMLSLSTVVMAASAAFGVTCETKSVCVDGAKVAAAERRSGDFWSAARYVIPEGEGLVSSENTTWVADPEAKVWYQPLEKSYESPYISCRVKDIPEGTEICLPVTMKLTDGRYAFISEANVVDWTDSAVRYEGDGRFAVFYYAQKKPFDPEGTTSPWRVTIVTDTLEQLFNSTVISDLCPDPPEERVRQAAKFAVPGRCAWQWLAVGDPVYADQKSWYDATKALGWEYYLIDAGWKDWRDGDDDEWTCLKNAIDYGKSIGVKSVIWVHSNEIPDRASRLEYLRKTKDAGAVGIKIDFMTACDFARARWYEETLEDTFAMGLFVDFHGAVKPSGREKTWPHELAREAVRGHEFHVTRYRRIFDFNHDTILPFCRLVQGHADYTPVVLEPMQLMRFTRAREIAQGIVFACPFLCFGDRPENYLRSDGAWLLKAMPSVYDESRLFNCSEIGEMVAVARRKGDEWFVGVENGIERRTSAKLDFAFLPDGATYNLDGVADNPKNGSELIEMMPFSATVRKGTVIDVPLQIGGGFAGRLTLVGGKKGK